MLCSLVYLYYCRVQGHGDVIWPNRCYMSSRNCWRYSFYISLCISFY